MHIQYNNQLDKSREIWYYWLEISKRLIVFNKNGIIFKIVFCVEDNT